MFKNTLHIIDCEVRRIDNDLRLFEMPETKNIRKPMACPEELETMSRQLVLIKAKCLLYMAQHGDLYEDDDAFDTEIIRYNKRHTSIMVALLICQLLALALILVISNNRENSPNGSYDGKKENIPLVIDFSNVFYPTHSEFQFKKSVAGQSIEDMVDFNQPHSFELIHTFMHPSHVFLAVVVANNSLIMSIFSVKSQHEFSAISNIFL